MISDALIVDYGVDYPLPRNVRQHVPEYKVQKLLITNGNPYLPPSHVYRYSLKEGMRGHEIYSLQVLLNQLTTGPTQLTEDGVFGSLTASKTRGLQKTDRLTIDGIAGPATQQALAKRAMKKIAKDSLLGVMPAGLMLGLIVGESGYIIGCVNWNVAGGVDAGLIQDRVYTGEYGSLARWRIAFGYESILSAAGDICQAHDDFFNIGIVTNKRAWQLAMLHHNWPWGATRLAGGKTMSTERAQWVVDIGVTGVTTPAQWCDHYVAMVTTYAVWGTI